MYLRAACTTINNEFLFCVGIAEAVTARHLSGSESDSDSDSESDGEVGAQAPPLTKQISNILNRYPEGGQILKVNIYRL